MQTKQYREPLIVAWILLFVGLLVPMLAAVASATNWPTGGHDGARTSTTPDAAPANQYLSWVFPKTFSDGIIADGRVYTVGYENQPANGGDTSGGVAVYALDANSGLPIWVTILSQGNEPNLHHRSAHGTLTLDNGNLFHLDWNGRLWAVRASDGTLLWSTRVGYDTFQGRAAPLVVNGQVIVQTDVDARDDVQDMELASVRTSDGVLGWHVKAVFLNGGVNLATDGTRVFGAQGSMLHAWSLADGSHLWQFSNPNGAGVSSAVLANGLLYTVGIGESPAPHAELFALNPATGATAWSASSTQTDNGCCYFVSPAYPPAVDGNLIVFASHGLVLAYDATSHNQLWSYMVGGPIDATPLLTSDTVVAARARDWSTTMGPGLSGGNLVAIDRASHNTKWTLPFDPLAPDYQGGQMAADATHIIGGLRHTKNFQVPYESGLYAIGPDTIPPLWVLNPDLKIVQEASGAQKLQWNPASDLNMDEFRLQHSTDGATWNTFAVNKWSGLSASTYDPADPQLHSAFPVTVPGQNFYRVIPADRAGNTGPASNVVTYQSSGVSQTTYPSPATTCSCPPPSPPPTTTTTTYGGPTCEAPTTTGSNLCQGSTPTASPATISTPTPTQGPPPSITPSGPPPSSTVYVPSLGTAGTAAAFTAAGAVAAFFRRRD